MRPLLGRTSVRLPLGGVASTDPAEVREPLVRPFWLLAAMALAVAFLWFVLLSAVVSPAH